MEQNQHATLEAMDVRLPTFNNILALVSQIQCLSSNLQEVIPTSSSNEAIQTTSLTLFAKVLVPREIFISSMQSTFNIGTNLSFGIQISFINKSNNTCLEIEYLAC